MKMKRWTVGIGAAFLCLSMLSVPVEARRIYSGATLAKEFDFGVSSCRAMVLTLDGATVWVNDGVNKVHALGVADLALLHSYDVPALATWGLALTPDNTQVCVPGRENELLSLLDTATGTSVAGWPIAVPRAQSVVIDPTGTYAYATCVPYPSGGSDLNHILIVVDLATRATVATIPLGHESYPIALQMSADGAYVFVVESWANRVSIVRTADRTIVNQIPVGATPTGIALDGNLAYINSGPGSPGADRAMVFDITDVLNPIKVGEFSVAPAGVSTWGGLRVSRDGYAFLTDGFGGKVIVVDVLAGYSVVGVIPLGVGTFPGDVVLAADARKLFVSDVSGGVFVFDLSYVLPVASCHDVTVGTDPGACAATVTPSQVDNGSADPEGDPLTATLTPAGPYPVGTTSVILTVTDPDGLSASCTALVTVNDTGAPVPNLASLPPVVGQCSAALPTAPTATDACEGVITATTVSPASFGQGDFTIVWVYTDSRGNSSTQNQQVQVHDAVAPVLDTPVNITVPATSPAGAVVTFPVPSASDNCDSVVPVTCAPASGSTFAIGLTTVTCTAQDSVGNATTVTFTVRVKGASEQLIDAIIWVNCQPLQPSVKAELLERLIRALFEPHRACRELADLVRYVERQAGKKLTVAQAAELTTRARRIMAVRACP